MSMAEGCRRIKFVGFGVDREGEMEWLLLLCRLSRACVRSLFPKLLKEELGDDLTEEAAVVVEEFIVPDLFVDLYE